MPLPRFLNKEYLTQERLAQTQSKHAMLRYLSYLKSDTDTIPNRSNNDSENEYKIEFHSAWSAGPNKSHKS